MSLAAAQILEFISKSSEKADIKLTIVENIN
jgi:hypothetical protein